MPSKVSQTSSVLSLSVFYSNVFLFNNFPVCLLCERMSGFGEWVMCPPSPGNFREFKKAFLPQRDELLVFTQRCAFYRRKPQPAYRVSAAFDYEKHPEKSPSATTRDSQRNVILKTIHQVSRTKIAKIHHRYRFYNVLI